MMETMDRNIEFLVCGYHQLQNAIERQIDILAIIFALDSAPMALTPPFQVSPRSSIKAHSKPQRAASPGPISALCEPAKSAMQRS
jgi:hypothetical protein